MQTPDKDGLYLCTFEKPCMERQNGEKTDKAYIYWLGSENDRGLESFWWPFPVPYPFMVWTLKTKEAKKVVGLAPIKEWVPVNG